MSYHDDYPTKPIGDGNPYHCCAACGRSVPDINGRIDGHNPWCSWRLERERGAGLPTAPVYLPPLPPHDATEPAEQGLTRTLYGAGRLQDYARTAVLADRARRAPAAEMPCQEVLDDLARQCWIASRYSGRDGQDFDHARFAQLLLARADGALAAGSDGETQPGGDDR